MTKKKPQPDHLLTKEEKDFVLVENETLPKELEIVENKTLPKEPESKPFFSFSSLKISPFFSSLPSLSSLFSDDNSFEKFKLAVQRYTELCSNQQIDWESKNEILLSLQLRYSQLIEECRLKLKKTNISQKEIVQDAYLVDPSQLPTIRSIEQQIGVLKDKAAHYPVLPAQCSTVREIDIISKDRQTYHEDLIRDFKSILSFYSKQIGEIENDIREMQKKTSLESEAKLKPTVVQSVGVTRIKDNSQNTRQQPRKDKEKKSEKKGCGATTKNSKRVSLQSDLSLSPSAVVSKTNLNYSTNTLLHAALSPLSFDVVALDESSSSQSIPDFLPIREEPVVAKVTSPFGEKSISLEESNSPSDSAYNDSQSESSYRSTNLGGSF